MSIIYAHSDETGAPVLNNAAGSLNAILHAVLVTGWRVQTLTSLVVAGGVATATLAAHGYSDGAVVEISGATPSALNGQWPITVTGSGTFTFPTTATAGTATGTISVKRAAAGWTRTHNSGNVSIYGRTDPLATSMSLYVNDSATAPEMAEVRMVWGVTDIATWANQAPATGAYYWPKGQNSSAAKKWIVVADERTAYLWLDNSDWPASSYNGVPMGLYAFGDIAGDAVNNAFDCLLSGASSGNGAGSGQMAESRPIGTSGPNGSGLMARNFTGIGSPAFVWPATPVWGVMGGSGPVFPSPVDNGLRLHAPALLQENNTTFNYPLRGALRGVALPLTNVPFAAHRTVIPVAGSTRRWILLNFRQQTTYGCVAMDLTGPW